MSDQDPNEEERFFKGLSNGISCSVAFWILVYLIVRYFFYA